ncbi:TPA: hypothetical protein N3288_003361 [Klebsiella aerogenes]|nr:hypothetical protein [Klebsiella aerogenes]
MTNTTELAQSLKAAAENAIGAHERLAAYPYGEIIDISQHEGEQIDIDITDINKFHEEASPANIRALVEALEKAQRANAAQDDHINQQQDRIEQLERGNRYAAKRISSWRRLAKQSIAEQEKCVNELDAARQRIVELDRKNSELDSLTQRWAVERAENAERIAELEPRTVTVKLVDINEFLADVHDKALAMAFRRLAEGVREADIAALTAAGIKWEAE